MRRRSGIIWPRPGGLAGIERGGHADRYRDRHLQLYVPVLPGQDRMGSAAASSVGKPLPYAPIGAGPPTR